MMTFYDWMMKYYFGKEGELGKLALYMKNNQTCPKDGDEKSFERFFRQCNAKEEYVKSLKLAFKIFEQ